MILRDQAARIKDARYLLDMNQRQLASAIGVTQATVSHWETRGAIHARSMLRIEEMLKARERSLGPSPPLLRLEAATLARELLEEATAGAIISRRLRDNAIRVLELTRGETT